MKLMYILFVIIIFTFLIELFNRILYSKVVGVIVLKKKNNTIYTTFSILTLIRYLKKGQMEEFRKDCEIFFNSLEENVEYATYTHGLILKEIKKRCREVSYEKTKKKRMILAKLFIGNTENLLNKHQYYRVSFKL